MNENYNKQFITLDFKQLDDPAFLKFIGTAEWPTLLILLRYVWRGGEHRLGLQELYKENKWLVSAVGREFIAQKLGLKDETRVSKHLKKLEELKVIQRVRTGRETITIVGEWFDISEGQDGSTKKEWFYYERVFGKNKQVDSSNETQEGSDEDSNTSDVVQKATSDVQNTPHQTRLESPPQTWLEKPHSNIINKKIKKTVNVNGDVKKDSPKTGETQPSQHPEPNKTDLRSLPDIYQPKEKTQHIAQNILAELGDEHSKAFYYLVAAKVPEGVILKTLSEIRQGGAKNPPKVFTSRMREYATEITQTETAESLKKGREDLYKKMTGN